MIENSSKHVLLAKKNKDRRGMFAKKMFIRLRTIFIQKKLKVKQLNDIYRKMPRKRR